MLEPGADEANAPKPDAPELAAAPKGLPPPGADVCPKADVAGAGLPKGFAFVAAAPKALGAPKVEVLPNALAPPPPNAEGLFAPPPPPKAVVVELG